MKSVKNLRPMTRLVQGQTSWVLSSSQVEAFVTQTGGHLGPVTFDRQGKKLRPYSVAPWVEEKNDPTMPPIIRVLRGDFFCLPFGGNATPFRGERHPVHGETANARWRFESLSRNGNRQCLHLSLDTKVRKGRVDKKIILAAGHNVVYCRHIVSGMNGPMNLGHHAMIKFPDAPGGGRVSTSGFVYGQVFPSLFEQPENKGYSILKAGAEFNSLDKVPTITGDTADLTQYPARRGFEDLVMLVNDSEAPFAWTAVAFPKERHVWFALKNPKILRQTIFWISNGGRHYAPWNGRHINVMGIEDVTSYFHVGLAESARPNPISKMGYPTCHQLSSKTPLVVPYIMGTAVVPAGFDKVSSIQPVDGKGAITLLAASGKRVTAPIDLDFLQTGSD